MLSCEMLGASRELLERTVAYLQEREQFDVKIGTFQALQHRLATAYCELELAAASAFNALLAMDEGRTGPVRARQQGQEPRRGHFAASLQRSGATAWRHGRDRRNGHRSVSQALEDLQSTLGQQQFSPRSIRHAAWILIPTSFEKEISKAKQRRLH